MGLFYSSPSKPNFFRIGRGPLPMRPQKIPGKAAPTWSLKMLNRIRVFPQNLALGMKTHINKFFYDFFCSFVVCRFFIFKVANIAIKAGQEFTF